MSKRTAGSDLNSDNWDHDEISEELGIFKKATDNELKGRKFCKGKRTLTELSAGESTGPSIFKTLIGFGNSNTGTSTLPSFSFVSSNSSSAQKVSPFSFGKTLDESNNSGKLNTSGESKKDETSMFHYAQSSNEAKPKTVLNNQSPEQLKFPLFNFGGSPKVADNKTTVSSVFNVEDTPLFSFSNDKSQNFGSDKSGFQVDSNAVSSKVKGALNGNDKVSSDSLSSQKESYSDEYLSDLKSLNESVFDWMKDHLDRNKFINLNPIFEDYKSHYDKLKQKRKEDKSKTVDKKTNSSDKSSFSFTSDNKSSNVNEKTSFLTEPKTSSSIPTFSFNSTGFKSASNDSTAKSSGFSFSSTEVSSSGLSFGSRSSTTATTNSDFSFGKPLTSTTTSNFSFGSKPTESNINFNQTDDEEPPKVEITEVKEDDAIYEKKVKLFYKKENTYVDKGVGTLFIRPNGSKMQLIIRALTNLGNILLNIVLNESLPTQRMGKNNVLLVCVPNPPIDSKNPNAPVSMLIRVKTSDDADELLAKIDEHKKSTGTGTDS